MLKGFRPGHGRSKQVFWYWPIERAVLGRAASAFVNVGIAAERHGYRRLPSTQPLPQNEQRRIDLGRHRASLLFLEVAQNPDDQLVMLDGDHDHPDDIVHELAQLNLPVVAAVCVRRSPPYDPQVYLEDNGRIFQPVDFKPGVTTLPAKRVGTGAIAIQRRAFDTLEEKGFLWPWFRFQYEDHVDPTFGEDWYFMDICDKAGILRFAAASVESPHLDIIARTMADHKRWMAENPDHKPIITLQGPEGGTGGWG
jgi:hypothetical protein